MHPCRKVWILHEELNLRCEQRHADRIRPFFASVSVLAFVGVGAPGSMAAARIARPLSPCGREERYHGRNNRQLRDESHGLTRAQARPPHVLSLGLSRNERRRPARRLGADIQVRLQNDEGESEQKSVAGQQYARDQTASARDIRQRLLALDRRSAILLQTVVDGEST